MVKEVNDLISRADAIEAIMKHHDGGLNQINYGLTLARYELQSLPSADTVSREAHYDAVANRITEMEERGFVSVVRCKDCKHYIVEGITTQYGWCHEYKHSVDEDDYCSYGERREE